MAQQEAYIRYNGPLNEVIIEGLGHFTRGESKRADYLTACAFRNNAETKAEGWEVSDTPFENPDVVEARKMERTNGKRTEHQTER